MDLWQNDGWWEVSLCSRPTTASPKLFFRGGRQGLTGVQSGCRQDEGGYGSGVLGVCVQYGRSHKADPSMAVSCSASGAEFSVTESFLRPRWLFCQVYKIGNAPVNPTRGPLGAWH
jgi:hypothetical protein